MLPQDDGSKPRGCGRVSIVTEDGGLVYDAFVHYGDTPHMVDRPSLGLGVLRADIQPENGAQLYGDVLKVLKTAFDKSGAIVGHAIKNDIAMLCDLDWSPYKCYDTQLSYQLQLKTLSTRPQLGLSALVYSVLGKTIQADATGHSSVEDARATMELWQVHVAAVKHQGGDRDDFARYYLRGQERERRDQPVSASEGLGDGVNGGDGDGWPLGW
jgi:hypothetical protein